MQENEFENSIRKTLDELQFVPKEAVWNQVNARIEKDKRKRRFVLLFWLTAFLVAGGGALLHFSGSEERSTAELAKTEQAETTYKKESEQDPATAPSVALAPGEKDELSKEINRNSGAELTASKKAVGNKGAFTNTLPLQQKRNRQRRVASPDNQQAPVEKPAEELLANSPNFSESITSRNSDIEVSVNETTVDSTLKPLPVQESKAAAADASLAVAISVPKAPANKKWKFGVAVFAGISDNVTPIKLLPGGNNYLADYSNAAPVQNNTGGLNSSQGILPLKYKSSFSYSVGVIATRQLTKKSAFSTGIEYLYLSSLSKVGNKSTTSPARIYDSALSKSAEVKEYYGAGETVSFVNQYHLVQVPLNMQFQFNKRLDRPAIVNIGLSPGWLVGSRALYANNKERMYYREDDQLKKFVLSGQIRLQFTIANSSRFRFTTGPSIQYSFTNITKPVVRSEQHFLSGGIKTNIIIK